MTPSCCSRRTELRQCRKNTTMNRSAAEQDLTQRAQRTQSSQRRRGNDMRVRGKFGTMMIASVLAAAGVARAQEMRMPQQEQHQHMEIPPVKPEYPRMGRAQEHAQGVLVTLEQAQELLEARRDMGKIAQDSAETQRRLMNTGQADETEVLEAEVEAQRMRMASR